MVQNEFYIIEFYHKDELVDSLIYRTSTIDEIIESVRGFRDDAKQNKPLQIARYVQKEDGEWLVFSEALYYHMGYVDQVKVLKGVFNDLEEITSLTTET